MRYAIPWGDGLLRIVSSLSHGINEARKRQQVWQAFVFVELDGKWVRYTDWEATFGR